VLWRTPFGTLLTAAVIGIALALPAGAYLVLESVRDLGERFTSPTDVSLFLRPEVTDEQALVLGESIRGREGVSRVRVIGKSQALAELRSGSGMGYGLDSLGGVNPLPAVLVVTPAGDDSGPVAALVEGLSTLPEVEFVQADQEWLARLQALLEVARRALWLLGTLLAAGIVLVVGNTLRLTIEARRSEVEIMKLFGASDAFVRRPFLYHGLFHGLSGALIACALLLAAGATLAPPLERLAALYAGQLVLAGPGLGHLLALLATGAVLGLLGAWLCVGRHLRDIEPR
jgi:cell division transport system permease protein